LISYGLDTGNRGSLLGKSMKFCLRRHAQTALMPSQPLIHWIQHASSSELKRLKCDADNFPYRALRLNFCEFYLH
jgi:hypothetical protein